MSSQIKKIVRFASQQSESVDNYGSIKHTYRKPDVQLQSITPDCWLFSCCLSVIVQPVVLIQDRHTQKSLTKLEKSVCYKLCVFLNLPTTNSHYFHRIMSLKKAPLAIITSSGFLGFDPTSFARLEFGIFCHSSLRIPQALSD